MACKLKFEESGELIQNLDSADIFSNHNMQCMREFSEQVCEDSQLCSRQKAMFAAAVCRESKIIAGFPWTAYAVVSMGSLAKSEITPYSDFEYLFLIAEGSDKTYFHNLAIDTYFRISNLGETPLKYFFIEELYDGYGSLEEKRWFDDNAPSGIKFDRLTPNAGNIPTGNGVGELSLIVTVDELIEIYQDCLQSEDDKCTDIVGDFSTLLASTQLVHHFANGDQLYQQFVFKRAITEQDLNAPDNPLRKLVENKRIETFLADMRKYQFGSDPDEYHIDFAYVQVKTDIFRYPTIFAHDLKSLLQYVDCQTADQVYKKLFSDQHIKQETLDMLQFVLMSAIWSRTSAYLNANRQNEFLSFHQKFDVINDDDRFFIPKRLYIPMACAMLKMKQSFSVNDFSTLSIASVQDVLAILGNLEMADIDDIQKSRIHFYCGNYKAAYQAFTERGLNRMHVYRIVLMLSNGLSGLCKELCETFAEDETASDSEKLVTVWIGTCCIKLGGYTHPHFVTDESTERIVEAMLGFIEPLLTNIIMPRWYTESPPEDHTTDLLHIQSLLNFHKNLQVHESCAQLYETVLGVFKQLFSCHGEKRLVTLGSASDWCYQIAAMLVNDSAHTKGIFQRSMCDLALSRVYYNMMALYTLVLREESTIDSRRTIKSPFMYHYPSEILHGRFNVILSKHYISSGLYNSAMRRLNFAEQQFKKVYGNSAAAIEISAIKTHQAIILLKLGKYTEARYMCQSSLDMLEKSEQRFPINRLENTQILASIHIALQDYISAQASIRKCITMIKENFQDRPIVCKALVQISKADLLFRRARDSRTMDDSEKFAKYLMAVSLLTNAIDILENKVMVEYPKSHPDLTQANKVLGQIYLEMNDTAEAMTHLTLAKAGFITAYDGHKRPQIDLADTIFCIGQVQHRQENFSEAKRCFQQSLYMVHQLNSSSKFVHPITSQMEIALETINLDVAEIPEQIQVHHELLD